MVTTDQGHNDDVNARLAALRAGAESLSVPRAGSQPDHGRRPEPQNRPWLRTRSLATLTMLVLLVAAGSFAAGWISATIQTTAPQAPQATGPAQPGDAVPAPVAATPANGHSSTYTYSVQSNYPVALSYIDANGDRISLDTVTAPWTTKVTTSSWGADAEATVRAYASTDKGDAFVSCTVTDASGKVVASDKEESAMPWASCYVG